MFFGIKSINIGVGQTAWMWFFFFSMKLFLLISYLQFLWFWICMLHVCFPVHSLTLSFSLSLSLFYLFPLQFSAVFRDCIASRSIYLNWCFLAAPALAYSLRAATELGDRNVRSLSEVLGIQETKAIRAFRCPSFGVFTWYFPIACRNIYYPIGYDIRKLWINVWVNINCS